MFSLERFIRSRIRLIKGVSVHYHAKFIPLIRATTSYEEYLIQKPKKTMAALSKEFLIYFGDIKRPRPVPFQDLLLFHTERYLERSLDQKNLAPLLGLSKEHIIDYESLILSQRLVVQATIDATKMVTERGRSVAINVGGGLHHARPNDGGGFCLYNDIGVAIKKLRANGYDKKILIVDLDYHQGNGNLEGLSDDERAFHFLISGDIWTTEHFENGHQIELPHDSTPEQYLTILKRELIRIMDLVSPSLVYFIAGSDTLKGDFFGKFSLSLYDLFQRDKFVIQLCKSKKIPLVITLGGGYGISSWKGSFNMIRFCISGHKWSKMPSIPNDKKLGNWELLYKKINQGRKKLVNNNLTITLSEEDIFPEADQKKKILSLFGEQELEYSLQKYGIIPKILALGFKGVELIVTYPEEGQSLIKIFGRVNRTSHLLIESLVYQITHNSPFNPNDQYKLLHMEWLLQQNPNLQFNKEHPPLPGQRYPGLGIVREVLLLVIQGAKRLNLDGISFVPAHFHIACKTCGDYEFSYLNPAQQGKFLALRGKLVEEPATISQVGEDELIVSASWALEEKKILTESGQAIDFDRAPIALPLTEPLANYFKSEEFRTLTLENYLSYYQEHWTIKK